MITVRRGDERKHVRRRQREAWLTFAGQDQSTLVPSGFGPLTVFEEGRLPPRTSHRKPIREEAEIITYVREGTLAYEDSTGRSGLLSAGEFQRMTAGRGIRYGETNTSPTEWAHVFQLWLRSSVLRLEPGHEQKLFSMAERRGVLRVVASPDGKNGSLLIHQDARLFSTILDRGQHVVHELSGGRCAWLHIVQGTARCGLVTMGTGDGAGIEAEPSVSLTASEETEVLLLDLSASSSSGELT
jgi:redox-sensitive bicupin YhaK (pirin superfamily)